MYESWWKKSLKTAFSVLNKGCDGCQYEVYPYKARLPVSIDGKYPVWEFKSDEDVWKVVELIIQETQDFNSKEGKEFDVFEAVYSQIPFFACRNIFFDKESQKDLERYLYCEKFGVAPYKGDYGEQPFLWVQKSSLIRKYLAKFEKRIIDGNSKKN